MKTIKVVLLKSHTHRGVCYDPAKSEKPIVLELAAHKAERLIEIGTAKPERPLKAVDTKED